MAKEHFVDIENSIKQQFSARCADFDISANWITDESLIRAHTDLAGEASGCALELCCGTGQVGRALQAKGWRVRGLDICSDMAKTASKYFPVLQGRAEEIPFESGCFSLVVCRQAFHFLNIQETLSEIARVLEPRGTLVLSLTVPFSENDRSWLYEIHRIKQPFLKKFYTAEDLTNALQPAHFSVIEARHLKVRESITRWMKYAPELSQGIRRKVISAVKNAPELYKKLHNVQIKRNEVFEDWNWVVLKAALLT